MHLIDFGCTDYETIWHRQKELVSQRLQNQVPDTLLMGEHPHVLTLGRGSHTSNVLAPHIPVVEIERGGDVTYHGPGQLIVYPILLLKEDERDLHRYLRNLEEVLLKTLEPFGIQGHRHPGYTGVWVKDAQGTEKKIASIGVAVKQWVTYHGIALNVSTDLSYFTQINPCGLQSEVMTSMEALLEQSVALDKVKRTFVDTFQQVFQREEETLPIHV